MKVGGSNGVGSAQGPSGLGAKPVAGGFSIASPDGAQETQASARLASTLGVGSIDALLALQEVGGPTERRRKAVRRAGVILDVLDDLKIAVLDGGISPATLGRLIEAVRQERARTGDTRLDDVLDEIETRAEVEMAKHEQHAAAT
jgi:Class II flagellar assembly regulator